MKNPIEREANAGIPIIGTRRNETWGGPSAAGSPMEDPWKTFDRVVGQGTQSLVKESRRKLPRPAAERRQEKADWRKP